MCACKRGCVHTCVCMCVHVCMWCVELLVDSQQDILTGVRVEVHNNAARQLCGGGRRASPVFHVGIYLILFLHRVAHQKLNLLRHIVNPALERINSTHHIFIERVPRYWSNW